MAEFDDLEKVLEGVILDMKKSLMLFRERPVATLFDRLRISYGDPECVDEIYVWFDFGAVSFFLCKKKVLLDLFSWISAQLGFNICVQSLNIPGDKYYVIPSDVEDYAGAQIWSTLIYKDRQTLFTCVLKELPLTEEERTECPEGGAWRLWCFLVEPDEVCTVHVGQMN